MGRAVPRMRKGENGRRISPSGAFRYDRMPPDQGQMMETDLILAPLDAGPSARYFGLILEEERRPP